MKVAMHPLMVAVALGLLSPGALDVVADTRSRPTASGPDGPQPGPDDSGDGEDAAVDALLSQLLDDRGDHSDALSVTADADAEAAWAGLEAPSAEAVEAVESAWLEARRLV